MKTKEIANSTSQPPQNDTPNDSVNVLTFGVGHGDCLLVEFVQNGRIEFRLLYDGGVKLPLPLLDYLESSPRAAGAPDLDVVVLSHVDNDHQGGLHELFSNKNINIGEYWSPCLPAFERLSWLFHKRVAKAVAKAGEIEKAADARGIRVIYPMEDHVQRFTQNSAVTVSIISPARRLLKEIYYARVEDLKKLVRHTPLPLDWLISGSSIGEANDNHPTSSPFDGTTATTRAQLPAKNKPDPREEAKFSDLAKTYDISEDMAYEPNFFGNSVLNDTSLIVVVDVSLNGIHRRRIVLAGDQENWSYISSRHPMGLAPDVLKVPHHGGRIYLEDVNRPKAEALRLDGIGQFFIWMRPRIAIVSAKGVYDLPRSEFREAVRMMGTTLVCPNKRSRELIFSGDESATANSCYEQFQCGKTEQHKTLKLTLGMHEEDLDAAACLQGNCHRGAAPVVVMQQRLIEPDESFVRWTTAEVQKQAHWLEEFLRGQRTDLLKHTENSFASRFETEMVKVSWNQVVAVAKARGYVHFAANPEVVLRYATAHGLIWAESNWGIKSDGLVAALSEPEYKKLLSWITGYKGLLLVVKNWNKHFVICKNWFSLLESAEVQPLMQLCAAWAGLPFPVFKQEVGSRLLSDLQSHFSCRVAQPNCLDSERLLHLYSNSTTVDDFFDENWNGFKNLSYGDFISEKDFDLLLSNRCSVLPPFRFFLMKRCN